MKKTLIIFFTLLFSFTSFSVFAKEYIMTCEGGLTFKLVDSSMDKNLYHRYKGKWINDCNAKFDTFIHNGDGAVCKTIYDEEHYKDEDDKLFLPIDRIATYDFILNEMYLTFPRHKNVKDLEQTCKKL